MNPDALQTASKCFWYHTSARYFLWKRFYQFSKSLNSLDTLALKCCDHSSWEWGDCLSTKRSAFPLFSSTSFMQTYESWSHFQTQRALLCSSHHTTVKKKTANLLVSIKAGTHFRGLPCMQNNFLVTAIFCRNINQRDLHLNGAKYRTFLHVLDSSQKQEISGG